MTEPEERFCEWCKAVLVAPEPGRHYCRGTDCHKLIRVARQRVYHKRLVALRAEEAAKSRRVIHLLVAGWHEAACGRTIPGGREAFGLAPDATCPGCLKVFRRGGLRLAYSPANATRAHRQFGASAKGKKPSIEPEP